MKRVPLTQGKFALVDNKDFAKVIQSKWYANRIGGNCYAIRSIPSGAGERMMHRFLLDAPDGTIVDHINHDGLDNRRKNIRLCSRQENSRNQLQHSDNATGFKGVYRISSGKYRGQLWLNGKRLHFGLFSSASDAARAYDAEAKKLFGRFAQLNFSK